MIQEIYYGNVEHMGTGTISIDTPRASAVVEAKNEGIYTSTFDINSIVNQPPATPLGAFTYKVDMLFYNRVNSLGKVLSSIVYLSTKRSNEDTSNIGYLPKYLYRNSEVELGMDLSCITDFSYFNRVREPAGAESYFVVEDEDPLPISGYPSALLMDSIPVLDGWYTVVSAGVLTASDQADLIADLHKDALAILNPITGGDGETVYIALKDEPRQSTAADWHDYTVYDNTVDGLTYYVDSDYEEYTCAVWPPYIRQDFFVMHVYNELYKKFLLEYASDTTTLNELFTKFRSKQRVINSLALQKNFKEAQLYLQSTDYTRISEILK